MFKACIFLFIFAPLSLLGQQAKSEQQLEAHIATIQVKLKTLKNQLNQAYGEEQQLIGMLEVQDRNIASVAKQIENINQQIQTISKRINATSQKIQGHSQSIQKQKVQIVELLKLQVYLNHDKTLKLLMANSQNSSSVQSNHQIKYLQNRLYKLIKVVALEIKDLEQLKIDQQQWKSEENIKRQGLLLQKNKILEQRKARLATLNLLKTEISKHETESQSLDKDQQRLMFLLDEIQVLLSDLPSDLGSNKSFYQLKGLMPKPVKGKYIRSYHSKMSENTRWDGVVIQGQFGDEVQAIAYGRVAFADWLRGFGMLVIIDHKQGYMSLYGFNESLSVEVGDWVDANQTIATIGNSGTLATPAVYFEVRKDAKPLNPKSWVE